MKIFIVIFLFLFSLKLNAQDTSIILDTLINTKAHDFTIKTLKGKKHTLSKLKGKIVVLNFWYMTCAPCVQEMPLLNNVVEKYKNNKNVIFLAISVAGVEDVVKTFVKRKNFNYQIVATDFTIAKKQGVQLYPTNIVVDKTGKIIFAEAGYNDNIKNLLIEEIEKASK